MPTISVIVPVYKAEKYLSRCVDSILGQTFSDFELLLVDDGSPDNCPELCDQYAAGDRRVRVIHQKNSGASAARNAGLDAARGEYVMFCDSDDVVAPRWMEHLYAAAKGGTVYPMCSYCRKPEDLGTSKPLSIPAGEALPASRYYDFQKAGLAGFVWNGCFARKILEEHHIRFRDKQAQGNYNEDLLFALAYAQQVEQIVYTGYRDYLYDTHADSLSHSWNQYYFRKYEEKYVRWYIWLLENGDDQDRAHLAETMLYHFFVSLHQVFAQGDYGKFKSIVRSEPVQGCAGDYRGTGENPAMVKLLRGGHSRLLWLYYKLHQLKSSL